MEFHEVEKDYRKQRFRSLLRADRIKESLSTNKILDLKPQNMTVATPPPDQLVKPDLQSTTVDIRVKFKPKKVKPKRNNSVYAIFKNVIKSSHSHSPIRAPTPIREVTPPRLKQSNYKPPASFFATPEDAINRRYKGRLAILDKSPRDQYRTPSDPRVRHIRAQKVLRCRTPSPPKRSPRQV